MLKTMKDAIVDIGLKYNINANNRYDTLKWENNERYDS